MRTNSFAQTVTKDDIGTAASVRTRPIIFSPEMVRAVLDNRKSQTRRLLKPQPEPQRIAGQTLWGHKKLGGQFAENIFGACFAKLTHSKFGVAGDRLWVREAWKPTYSDGPAGRAPFIAYRAGPEIKWPSYGPSYDRADEILSMCSKDKHEKWHPSIHMPRWVSRITLEITKVRVERLQSISEEDAGMEGAPRETIHSMNNTARMWYRDLWDSLHGKGAWADNPWVWVLEFRRL